MRTQAILLTSLLAVLYGCQPETQEPVVSPVVSPAVEESVAVPAADKVMTHVVAEPASAVEDVAEPVVEKAVVAEKIVKPVEKAPAKAAVIAEKVVKPVVAAKQSVADQPVVAEVAPVVVAPKAEVKPEVNVPVPVSEADAMALAKKNACLTCHAIDQKKVGPAWKDVAVKYRGDASAEAYLVNKISTGGSGVWGSMKMPAHPKISEADRRKLARFVLGL